MKYKWVALTVATVGVLMVGIDTRIVIVGLPQVAAQLQADAEQAIWITQFYVLANTVLLLLIGRLGDIFGRVRIYTVGFGVFAIGSALTSLGMNPIQVIVFRAVQGVGAALVFTNSIAVLIMSLTAPYEVITKIISAINPLSIPVAERLLFVESLKNTYVAFGVINALAIIPSLLQVDFKSKPTRTTENSVDAVLP